MKIICSAVLSLMALMMYAQPQANRRVAKHKTDTVTAFVKAYSDSLSLYKQKLDSLQQVNNELTDRLWGEGSKYARLFLPTTFYHNIIRHRFELSNAPYTKSTLNEMIENALLYIYMMRPDLVKETQSQLAAEGKVSTSQEHTINNKTTFVDKVEPMPVETEYIPVNLIVKKPKFWKFNGDGYLQFLQNEVSDNWYKGGESNYSMLGSVTLNLNYNNRQKLTLDHKLEMKLGFQTIDNDSLRSLKTNTDDIRYTCSFGVQATKNWYYSLQLIANTQFMRGYKNNNDKVFSDFLSPLNLDLAIGMRYSVNWLKGRLRGNVNLSPLAYHYRYVDRSNLVTLFGIEKGKHHVDDYGSSMNIDLTWNITDMVRWKTRLYGYTSYKRAEVEWENTLSVQFTRFLSTNLYFYPRFDDSRVRDAHKGYFMYKEYLSIGLSNSF